MVHTMDYFFNEVQNKQELIQKLRSQCDQEQQSAQDNVEFVKEAIDQAVAFHMETMHKRGNWLKSHAEHIFTLMQESLSQKLRQLDDASSQLASCLENADSAHNEKQISQAISGVLSKIDLSPPLDNAILTFNADGNSLRDSILSFGNISTSFQDEIDETESFLLADDECDGIQVLSKCENVSLPNTCGDEWLLQKASVKKMSVQTIEDSDDDKSKNWLHISSHIKEEIEMVDEVARSPWLLRVAEETMSDCGRGSPISTMDSIQTVDQQHQEEDYACFLLKNTRINDQTPISTYLDDESFLHQSSRSKETYRYPSCEFLEHWEFLENQETSQYLVPKTKDDSSTTLIDDETCQWLYRKDLCSQKKCASEGCDLFDKNWLRTANDW